MTGIVLLGLCLQAGTFNLSRAASASIAFFASALLLLVSAGKMAAGLPAGLFGLELPALVPFVLAVLWLGLSIYLLFREARADLVSILRQVCLGFARGVALSVFVLAVMAVVVLPCAFLAISFPLLFSLLVLAGLLALLVLSLYRKYRAMQARDAGDTRESARCDRPPLWKRYLFRVLLRPGLIIILALAYAYICLLFLHSSLWGGIGLVLLSLSALLAARLFRRTPYTASGD